ncbi:MAG: hypothetical protein ABIG37_01530 [Nanoarchaeota archaeon]|nr:hypothetical protein [Nanoarchaeota archaeon]
MKNKLTKKEVEKKIEDFFINIKNKKPEQIKKIKRLAMHYKIKLKDKKKMFCKKCYSNKLKTESIKKCMKKVRCCGCGKIIRWKVK